MKFLIDCICEYFFFCFELYRNFERKKGFLLLQKNNYFNLLVKKRDKEIYGRERDSKEIERKI